MVWTNKDNLRIKFGTEEATLVTGGAFNMGGTPLNEVELKVLGSTVASTAGTIPGRSLGTEGILIPKGVMLASVELFAEAAVTSSGGSATLDIGLKKVDDTQLDYDGLVASLDVDSATDGTGLGTIGNRVFLTQGSTANGALLGTITTDAGYLCMNYAGEAITGGVIVVRVRYYRPHSTNGTVA